MRSASSDIILRGLPSRDCPTGVDPTCRTLGDSFEVPKPVHSRLVDDTAVFGDVIRGHDHPGKVHKGNGSLGEASGTAVDAKAAACCCSEDAGPISVGALQPPIGATSGN